MEFNRLKPIYLQIADHIGDRILADQLRPDDKILSVRDLAGELEVNVNTIARTFDYLQQQGIIAARRGLGNYVTPEAKTRVNDLRRQEFFHTTLPNLFQSMRTLGITIEEVNAQWQGTR